MSCPSYWNVVPRLVRKSKVLNGDQKDLYYEIVDNLNDGGYCTLSNEDLAKLYKTTTRTISDRLASMKEKDYISITINSHKHERRIYPKLPGEPTQERKPTVKQLEPKTKQFQEALKKAIVFGTIDFGLLVEKLFESPYLEKVQDNSTQFILNEEQIVFLAEFKKLNKQIDCQLALYKGIDYNKLLNAIKESDFLLNNGNLTLKWFLQNSSKVINGDFKNYYYANTEKKNNFAGRQYTREELNALFQSIDDIDV